MRPALNGPPDEPGDHGADDRPDEARHLERAVVTVLAEQDVHDEAADERSDDAEQDGLRNAHRVRSRNERPGQEPGDQSDHQQEKMRPITQCLLAGRHNAGGHAYLPARSANSSVRSRALSEPRVRLARPSATGGLGGFASGISFQSGTAPERATGATCEVWRPRRGTADGSRDERITGRNAMPRSWYGNATDIVANTARWNVHAALTHTTAARGPVRAIGAPSSIASVARIGGASSHG